MANNINSASRLKNLFSKVLNRPNKKVDEIWAEVFKISEQDLTKRIIQVSTCLTQMYDEIELVREQMAKTKFSPNLFNPMLDQANSIVAIQNLTGSWDAYKTRITPELILSLGFCSEILETDDNGISEEQIKEILNLLNPLEEQLKNSQLSPHTKIIIKKHLEKIKEAISSYPIVGAKGFNEVMQSAYGEVVDNFSVFEEAKDTKEIKGLVKVWKKLKEYIDCASTLDKGASLAYKFGDKTNKAVEYFQTLLD